MAENIEIVIKATDQTKTGIASASSNIEGLVGKIANLSSVVEMRNIGESLTRSISQPLMQIGKTAITTSADFEQGLNVLQQVTKSTAAEMAAMEQQALDLGASSVFGALDVLEAQTALAKAGFTTQQTLASTAGVIDLAAAGQLEMVHASELLAAAINAFGLEATDANRVTDLLVAAANASAVDVADLGMAFTNVASVAGAAGIPIEDVATALALLGNNGLVGAEAGTALRTVLRQLTAPTEAAQEHMEALGIEVYNTAGQMNTLPSILAQLETGVSGLTDAQAANVKQTLLGNYGVVAGNILIREGADAYAAMKKQVKETGIAHEAAQARMSGFNGALENLAGAIETLMIEQGKPFLEMLTKTTNWLGNVIEKFSTLPSPIKNTILVVAALAAALGPLLVVTASIIGAITTLMPLFTAIGTVIAAVAGIISAPVVGIIAVIAAIVAGLALLAKAWSSDWGGIKTKTKDFVDWIGKSISGMWSGIVTWFKNGVSEASKWLGELVTKIATWFNPKTWLDMGINIIKGLIDGIKKAASGVLDALKRIVTDALGGVKALLGIRSPSAVMYDVGSNMMEGWASGIADGSSNVQSALSHAVDKVAELADRSSIVSTTAGLSDFGVSQLQSAVKVVEWRKRRGQDEKYIFDMLESSFGTKIATRALAEYAAREAQSVADNLGITPGSAAALTSPTGSLGNSGSGGNNITNNWTINIDAEGAGSQELLNAVSLLKALYG